MQTIGEAAGTFLANRRIAVTGVSRKGSDHGANTVYKRLRDRGYQVFAVNPNADRVEGDKAYHDLTSIPGGVDAVVIGTRPEIALDTMHECFDLGIRQVWMHRGPGAGSVSAAATAYGREHGITVIDGGCPLMFPPTSDFSHKVLKVVYSGNVPKEIWTPDSHGGAPPAANLAPPPSAPISVIQARSWLWIGVTFVVFAWSVVEVVSLISRHTTGPELYGVLVAALSALAGALGLAVLISRRRRVWATAAVLVLWVIVGLGGIAGSYAHVVGIPAEYGVTDSRPRPASAPLIFTALALVGGAALYLGERSVALRPRPA